MPRPGLIFTMVRVDRKLHVCLVIGDCYPPQAHGGVGTYASDLSRFLVHRGHQVSCICRNKNQKSDRFVYESDEEGVRVLRIHKDQETLPKRINAILYRHKIAELVRWVDKQRKIDILEFEDGGGLLAFGKLPETIKIARLHATTAYNDYELKRSPSRLMHLFERLALMRADHIISATDYVAEKTLDLLGLKKRYIKIPIGIDINQFSPDVSAQVEPETILFTGAIAPRKGVLELLKGFKIVKRNQPKAKLWLAGEIPQEIIAGSYVDQVLSEVTPEIRDNVFFLGAINRKELPDLIRKSQICCFPSKSETFGLGIIEAMACGRPVIYMNKQPGPEIINDGKDGLLCDTKSPDVIAASIERLLRDSEYGEELGKRARIRVVDNFNKDNRLSDQLSYYENLLGDIQK